MTRVAARLARLFPVAALRRAWRSRSLRWQVMAAVAGLNLAAGLVAAALIVVNARRATEVEMAASLEIAERLVRETLDRLAETGGGTVPLEQLPLQISGLRHVRIHIENAAGDVVPVLPPAGVSEEEDAADDEAAHVPGWFSALATVGHREVTVPVMENGRTLGLVRIAGEASDEVAEVWSDTRDLAMLALIVNVLVLAALFLVLGRLLRPLRRLAAGLRQLEEGRFEVRLAEPGMKEAMPMVERFNALGASLAAARAQNARLAERLIRVEDEERRAIASELHDELGPCLFGLRANLESVRALLARQPESLHEPVSPALAEPLAALSEIVDRLQQKNRSLLRRIRPMSLGHVPLADMLADLIGEFRQHAPGRRFDLACEGLRPHYGDSIEITLYRGIREAVTNALRHGRARHVSIRLQGEEAAGRLTLTVEDDGRGLLPDSAAGWGWTGIAERIDALGGSWSLAPVEPRGTRLTMTVPVPAGDTIVAFRRRATAS